MLSAVRSLTPSTKRQVTGYRITLKQLPYSSATSLSRLVEVGLLEDPKQHEAYRSGQLFLHRVFGYRGVVLFNWVSRLCNRDKQGTKTSRSEWEEEGVVSRKMKNLKFEKKTYYQVLIDQRDFHQVRSPPDGITLTINNNDKAMYSISGLDYVSHDHILPYVSTSDDKQLPIHHDLYPQFFRGDNEEGGVLSSWQHKNANWLKQVDIHSETTQAIKVTVMPFYLGCREIEKSVLHWWRYSICIENTGPTKVQLKQRHWRIFSSSGTLETVKGEGVVGQQPILCADQPAFQYSSHVSLQASSGHMWGTYRFEGEDGRYFDARIPPFNLNSMEKDEDDNNL